MLSSALPDDVTTLDVLAFGFFLSSWVLYTLIQDRLLKAPVAINRHLEGIREVWMDTMLERDNRIMDSQLVGHAMHSATFFASTTVLILAGVLGLFGAVEHAHDIVTNLTFTVKTSRAFLELKILLLAGVFAFGFFKFTWALRQFNYCVALMGSAPMPPVPTELRPVLAETTAGVLTLAITAFNAGLRAYYFAMAAIAWLIAPWCFMVATAGVVTMLARRQGFSATERLIHRQADALKAHRRP